MMPASDPLGRLKKSLAIIRGSYPDSIKEEARADMNAVIRDASTETLESIAKLDLWGRGEEQAKKDLEARKRILQAIQSGRKLQKRIIVL